MDKKDKETESEYTSIVSSLLSDQLKNEYKAFYFYTFCAAWLDRRQIELPGLVKFYKKMAKEELEHADGIINYMNSRGLVIDFLGVEPYEADFKNISDIIKASVEFEEEVLRHISRVYESAESTKDYSTTTFLDPYVQEQVNSIKELNGYFMNALRCEDTGHGLFIFDQSFKNKK